MKNIVASAGTYNYAVGFGVLKKELLKVTFVVVRRMAGLVAEKRKV